MSKDADKDVQEAAPEPDRRRRRRKGGGLRVPSDNVPRRSHDELSAPAPAPEDPHLAVSVAYAFSAADEPSGELGVGERLIDDDDLGPLVDDGRRTMETPAVRFEALGSAPASGSDSVDIALDDDGVPAEVHDEGPKHLRPIRERAQTMALSDEDLEELRVAVDGRERRDTDPHDDPDADPHANDVDVEASPDDDYPQISRSYDFDVEDSGVRDVPEAEEAEPTRAASEPAAAAPDAGPGAGEPPVDGDEPAELGDEVLEELDPSESGPVSAGLADDGGTGVVRPVARVPTEPPASANGAAASSLDEDGWDEPTKTLEPKPETASARAAAAVTPEVTDDAPPSRAVSEPAPRATSEPAPPPQEPAMARADEAPMAPSDAGDSGEIIADDLIEEVDDEAVPVTEAAHEPPPPPAKRAATDPPPPPAAAEASVAPARPTQPPPAPKPKESGGRAAAVAAAAGPQKSRRRKGRPWFEEIFTEDYLRTLPFLTPQATQREASFVVESLELDAGTQVLDVGCGYGRHSMELAARGFHVVALDASLPLLLRGADEAQRRGLTINFVHGDMRELTFESQFDGAYCLFSTFGYFDDETNKKAAQNIARALKPGARMVVQILNRDYLIGDLPSRVWWEGDGCVVLEEVEFNYFSSRVVSNRSVVFDDGRQLEQEISVRAYSLHEFGKLLHAAGFRVVEISGSMETRGRFFGNQSREIIVVAEKRASAGTSNGSGNGAGADPDGDDDGSEHGS